MHSKSKGRPAKAETVVVEGVELTLARPDSHDAHWIDYNHYGLLLEAAWLRMSPGEIPLNPRIVGDPGLGKTTLACAVARKLNRPLYVFQCTADTRPEDLVITPVLADDRRIVYRASAVVSAMICGGIAVLDEGNRMPERSWASLAPVMDDRRNISSEIAGIKIAAHPDFRLCVTMNSDASVYELPGYIQSRLKPKIELVAPPWALQQQIVQTKCPGVSADVMKAVLEELEERVSCGRNDSTRDMLTFAQYAQKLNDRAISDAVERASEQVLTHA